VTTKLRIDNWLFLPNHKESLDEKIRTSFLYCRIRRCKKYRTWRNNILVRDNGRCRHCNNENDLYVDHINRFNDIIHRNEIKTLDEAKNCLDLWDLNNGIN